MSITSTPAPQEQVSELPVQPKRTKEELYVELSKLLSYKRTLVARESILRFFEIYLPHIIEARTPEFHKELLSLLLSAVQKDKRSTEEKEKEKITKIQKDLAGVKIDSPEQSEERNLERLLFIAPRGFAKSTLCSVLFALYLSCYGIKKDIFLVSATMSLGKELLRKVRKEFETNEKLILDFGDLKSDKWTEEMLVLKNGVVIRAKGRGFQIRGFRPDILICDDLEDEEVIYSKDQREKLENWFFRTLLPALKPGQNVVYVGTKLHQFSLIAKLQQKQEFYARFYKAIVSDEKGEEVSIWEELWPIERLQKLRRELGSYAFEAEYQNNPISLAEQPVKPEMLDGVCIGGKNEYTCLAIDPAISEKEGSDYRAFSIFARTEVGFREVYSEKGRWGIDEQIERVIGLYEMYKPDRVLIEEVAFQKVFRHILLEKSRERKIFIPVSTAELGTGANKRPKDKFTRLLSVVHLFEQRLIEIKNPDLREELLSFPHGEHDDMVDATVFALYWLMNHRAGASIVAKDKQSLPIKTNASFMVNEVRPGVFMASTEELDAKPKLMIRPGMRTFINCDRR